jgi:uncharacterized protein YjbI with pentapeptide repeats
VRRAFRSVIKKLSAENADVKNADVKSADVKNADVENADVKNADVKNANVENADVKNADVENASVKNADGEVNENFEPELRQNRLYLPRWIRPYDSELERQRCRNLQHYD